MAWISGRDRGPRDKREQRLRLLEDHIGRSLTESAASGELRTAPSYGKPLHLGDGYEQTPAELQALVAPIALTPYAPRNCRYMWIGGMNVPAIGTHGTAAPAKPMTVNTTVRNSMKVSE